jgi:hypothetical protein
MANGKDMNPVKWLMCVLAVVAVVLAALILVKVNKKCGGTNSGSKSNKAKLRIQIPTNRSPVARTRNVRANDPNTISALCQQYCGNIDASKIAMFNAIMKFEDVCGPAVGSLWDDSTSPLGTADDMVMAYLCNPSIDITDENGSVIETLGMVDVVKKYYPWQYQWLQCALKPPKGDPKNCCGAQEPVWG